LIFVFSSLIIDINESSVTVETNVELIPFLSGVEIRFQSSLESDEEKQRKTRFYLIINDLIEEKPDSIFI
jgi:hypothetical protein